MIGNHRRLIRRAALEALESEHVGANEKRFLSDLFGRRGRTRHMAGVFEDLVATQYVCDVECNRVGKRVSEEQAAPIQAELFDRSTEISGDGTPVLDFFRFVIESMIENDFAFFRWFVEMIPTLIQTLMALFAFEPAPQSVRLSE